MNIPPRSQTLRVEGIPPAILAKITEYTRACFERAFIGAQEPDDHEAIEFFYENARYNLERTIKTELEKLRG